MKTIPHRSLLGVPITGGLFPCSASGELTSNTLVRTGETGLVGVLINTDGTNDAAVVVYDNTAASGTVVFKETVNGAENFGGIIFGNTPILAETGLYMTITGTGASCILYYMEPTDR